MVGEMTKIFCLLCILFSIGVSDAATMCVPDLSTCNSCTDGTYNGIEWKATCCGVEVSGVAVGIQFDQVEGAFVFNLASQIEGDARENACGCIVLRPVASAGVYVSFSTNCSGFCIARTTDVLRTLSKDNLQTEVPEFGGQ